MDFVTQMNVSEAATFVFRIVASIFCLLAVVVWMWKKEKENLPPGPKGLPFIGHIPFFTNFTPEKLLKWKEKYGDIFTFKLAGHRFVVLANYDLVKEALVMQGNNFSARPQDFSIMNWMLKNSGLLASDGQLWREHKRFMMQTLRDSGFGKTTQEGRMIDVLQSLVDFLEKSKGKPCDVFPVLSNCAMSIICSFFYNKMYNFDDPEFWTIKNSIRQALTCFSSINTMRPRLLTKYLPWFLVPNGRALVNAQLTFLPILAKKLQEHNETFDENHIRDYMDAHISKRKQAEAAGNKQLAEYFSDDHLFSLCAQMMMAATDTTASTAYWGFYFLATHPEVQKKMQKELDEVIGKERLPSYLDLPNLPYTEAVINEILRRTDIVPMNVVHQNFEDAYIAGYKIPERSVIIPSLTALHRDPKYWSDPEGFNPEHFLNSEGKKVKMDSFLPFSLGRRLCPGESLARMELFFFYTLVMQKFDLKFKEQDKPFPESYTGLIRLLKPYEIIATPRSETIETQKLNCVR